MYNVKFWFTGSAPTYCVMPGGPEKSYLRIEGGRCCTSLADCAERAGVLRRAQHLGMHLGDLRTGLNGRGTALCTESMGSQK